MKTNKLFYADTHLTEFSAVVVDCFEGKNGFEVELDQTAFYPEGGGQAADRGTLGGIEVLHVHEDGERVLHRMERALAVGEMVTGVIDYDHRFDLMQQHSGEHIVSGLINARYGHHNVGFHMGWDSITIDFDGSIPAGVFRRAGPPGRLHHSLELHQENRPGYRPGGDKAQRLPGSPERKGLFVLTAIWERQNKVNLHRIFLDFFGNNTCNPYGFQI